MATPPWPLWFCHFWVHGCGSSAFPAILPCFTSTGVVEVYRVTKRVELGIKATAVCSEKLQQLLKDIDKVWNNLISFMSLAALTVRPKSAAWLLKQMSSFYLERLCRVCWLDSLCFFSWKMEMNLFVKASLKPSKKTVIYAQTWSCLSTLMIQVMSWVSVGISSKANIIKSK